MTVEASEPRPTGRRWARTEETRRQVLEAAKDVFIEKGYTGSGISDVVARSGSSVGSVYHHFGGKAELYLAVWEQYVDVLARAAAENVAAAGTAGVKDPLKLFEAGTFAYLRASWEQRELLPIFYAGDGPPGFEVLRRERNTEWIRRNVQVLSLSDSHADRLLGSVLTALVGEASRMVIKCESPEEADEVAERAVVLARRLYEPER